MSQAHNSHAATDDSPWLSGARWQQLPSDESYVTAAAQKFGVHSTVAQLLYQREVALADIEAYLNPSLRDSMDDPLKLKGMEAATQRIAAAVQAGETIGVFGDYDVDGATSSALLLRYFAQAGIEAVVHIPDRQKEGYGPNLYGFNRLKEQGATLIITVDTGALAHQILGEAAELGFEVIVLDHHQGEPELPKAVSVVNPNRFDEVTDLTYLAAVGVTFLALVALHKKLKADGYFAQDTKHKEPELRWLLDIVALGTVCDVVPLIGLNRAFVTQGLKIMQQGHNAGMRALLRIAGVTEAANPYHCGFVIGPRINAGGRVGESDLGVKLLTTDDPEEAQLLAEQLDHFNKERRAIEATVLEQATAQAQAQLDAGEESMIFAVSDGWHEGVIGIAAGRIKDKFNLPTAVISLNAEGTGKASARSVSGVDMGQMVIAARQQGLLIAGGGHAMAAGFSVAADKRDEFIAFARSHLAAKVGHYQQSYKKSFAASLPVTAASVELCDVIEKCGPFGAGNAGPRFKIENVQVARSSTMGKEHTHLRLILCEARDQLGRNSKGLKAISFGTAQEAFGQALLNSKGRPMNFIGRLKAEEWQGNRSVTLMIEDACFVG